MVAYTRIQRRRIHRKAKAKLGLLVRDAQDRYDYIQQCMADMADSGETSDPEEARSICELLYDEEEADLFNDDW